MPSIRSGYCGYLTGVLGKLLGDHCHRDALASGVCATNASVVSTRRAGSELWVDRERDGKSTVAGCHQREMCVNSASRVAGRRARGAVTMAVAELTLFGGFGVRAPSEAAISLLGQKERALLAFLALPPGTTHSRDKLASLLWSDRGDPQARDSLKHALTRMRQCLQSTNSSAI